MGITYCVVVNHCWSELDTVSGSTTEYICCTLDIVCIWIQCADLQESGFAVLQILFVSGYSVQFYQRVHLQ